MQQETENWIPSGSVMFRWNETLAKALTDGGILTNPAELCCGSRVRAVLAAAGWDPRERSDLECFAGYLECVRQAPDWIGSRLWRAVDGRLRSETARAQPSARCPDAGAEADGSGDAWDASGRWRAAAEVLRRRTVRVRDLPEWFGGAMLRPFVSAQEVPAWCETEPAARGTEPPGFLAVGFPDDAYRMQSGETLQVEEARQLAAMELLAAHGCRELWLPICPERDEAIRPDPYHAAQFYGRWRKGENLTASEEAFLRRQAARFFAGQAQKRGWTLRLLLSALPESDPLQGDLVAYLRNEKVLPQRVRTALSVGPDNLGTLERDWPARRVLWPGLGCCVAVTEAAAGFPETDPPVALATLLALAGESRRIFGRCEGGDLPDPFGERIQDLTKKP